MRLMRPGPASAAYVAVLHFALPLTIAYTINGNYPSSRLLITIYAAILYAATISGIGFLGEIEADQLIKAIVATAIFALIGNWLYRSPKMRYYYAMVSGKSVPDDLKGREPELIGHA